MCLFLGPLQFGHLDRLPPHSDALKFNFQPQNTFRETTEEYREYLRGNEVEFFSADRNHVNEIVPNQSLKVNDSASNPKGISQDEKYLSAEAGDKTRSGKISKRSQQRAYEETRQHRSQVSKKLSLPPGNAPTNKQPYKCDQCGKIFKTKYTLTIHLKMPSHTGAKPFVCAICGKGFRLSSTLCRHKIIHTSEKPHKCHICDKAFNRSSTLKTHIRTHSEYKEFACDICGKGFHQKGNLRNHVLIHTGEKPYHCNLCEKAFNKLSNLKFHMHIHTDNAPYRCRYCKTCFTRRCDLKLHLADCNHQSEEGKKQPKRFALGDR